MYFQIDEESEDEEELGFVNRLSQKGIPQSCYMIAVINSLSSLAPLVDYLLQLDIDDSGLLSSFIKLLKKMRTVSNNHTEIIPLDFRARFIKLHPEFGDNQQHDCGEFMMHMLEAFHKQTKFRVKLLENVHVSQRIFYHSNNGKFHSSEFRNLFMAQEHDMIICHNCGNITHNYQPFMSINLTSLDPLMTLEQLLEEDYYSHKTISYKCDNCNKTFNSTKKLTRFLRLPEIMTIIINRPCINYSLNMLEHGGSPQTSKKFCRRKIDMKKYMSPSINTESKNLVYRLNSVIVHEKFNAISSSPDHMWKEHLGHYYSYCLHQDDWYILDDLDASTPKKCKFSEVSTSPASHMFFYIKS